MKKKQNIIFLIIFIVLIAISIITTILFYKSEKENAVDKTNSYPKDKAVSINQIVDLYVTTPSKNIKNLTEEEHKSILNKIEDTHKIFVEKIEKTKSIDTKNNTDNNPDDKTNSENSNGNGEKNSETDNKGNNTDNENKGNSNVSNGSNINIDIDNYQNDVKHSDIYIEKGFLFFYKSDFKYTENVKHVLTKLAKKNNISFKAFNLDDKDDYKKLEEYNLKYKQSVENQNKFNSYSAELNNFFNKSDTLKSYQKEVQTLISEYGSVESIKKSTDDYQKYNDYLSKINEENHKLAEIVNKNILNIVDKIYKPTISETDKSSIINSLTIIKELQQLNENEILEYVQLYLNYHENSYLINGIPSEEFTINLIFNGKLSQTINQNTKNTEVQLTDDILKDRDLLEKELEFRWY